MKTERRFQGLLGLGISWEVLPFICNAANLHYTVSDYAVTISPKP